MADITNPQAIKFDNEVLRPFTRRYIQLFREATAVQQQWNAQSLSAVVPNNANVAQDGAQADGRPIVNGANLTNAVTRAQEIVTDLTANNNAKLNTLLVLDRGAE